MFPGSKICEAFLMDRQKASYAIQDGIGPLSVPTQPAFTCSKLTIETLEQGV